MKILVKTFVIAALLAMTFVTNASNKNDEPTKGKTFEVGMFQSVNSMKMNVMIQKTTDKDLTVVLKNNKGEILISEHVRKNDSNYHAKYDLSELEDGKYIFEFTKGDEKLVKEVNLVTTRPTIINRQIALN